jgi:hypothetical protein
MAPLYRIEAAGAATQMSAAQENLVISVPSRSFLVRMANLSLWRARGEAGKLGTALCKKRPGRWTSMRITAGKHGGKAVHSFPDKCCITWGLPCESRAAGAG